MIQTLGRGTSFYARIRRFDGAERSDHIASVAWRQYAKRT